jgi:hypothetical protein
VNKAGFILKKANGMAAKERKATQRAKPQPNARLEQGRPVKGREKGKKMEAKI